MITKIFVLTILIVSSLSLDAQNRTWSGVVVDDITGEPITLERIRAASYLRYWSAMNPPSGSLNPRRILDPSELKGIRVSSNYSKNGSIFNISGSFYVDNNGRFSVTISEDEWNRRNLDDVDFFELRFNLGRFDDYFALRVVRSNPQQNMTVRLVPKHVFIKGKVISAIDGKPMADIRVLLNYKREGIDWISFTGKGDPHIGITDQNGNFSIVNVQASPLADRMSPPSFADIQPGLEGAVPDTYIKIANRDSYGTLNQLRLRLGRNDVYPAIPAEFILPSSDGKVHTYLTVRYAGEGNPIPQNPMTVELKGYPDGDKVSTTIPGSGAPGPGTTTPPSQPPTTTTPSGVVNLMGEWDINANNHRGKINITKQDGNQFSGTMFSQQLANGRVDGNKVTFTRLWSSGFRQDYTGTISTGTDGRLTMAGSFTQQGSGSYNWTATRTGPAPAATPPATTTQARFTVEAGKRNLSQGGSVTVPVSLNNVEALANMNVNIHYDPAVVKPARNASRGNIIPQSLFEANVRDRGVIRLGFAQQTDIRGTGTLAQIPFEAVGRPGTRTALRIEVTTANTAAGSRVTPAQLIHGEITIVGADGRLPGDTSGTGELTALDAMNALKMSVGNMAVNMVADVDRDGRVTARDATLILQQVVGRP